MIDQEQRQQLERIIDLVLRRKEFILICLLISMIVGVGHYFLTPKQFQATALIRYQKQSINPTKMSPDVQTGIKDMVNTVNQEVTSHSSLAELITKFNLFPELRAKQPMQDVVLLMRKHIAVKPVGGDVFQVSYFGSDPEEVQRITNELAFRFIAENQRFREEWAAETSYYVKDELGMAKKALDKKETMMRDYKLKYFNELPEQRGANVSMLNTLETRENNLQVNINDLERTRLLLRETIEQRKGVLAQAVNMDEHAVGKEGTVHLGGRYNELMEARKQLAVLMKKYTESHPDVRRMQNNIQALQAAMRQESDVSDQGQTAADETRQRKLAAGISADAQLAQMNREFEEINYNINRLREGKKNIGAQIAEYQRRVEAVPVREAEWSALTRDYNQLNQHYQDLVARNLAAESAQVLEARQKGSQFKIIDSAPFPEKPYKPDFLKIMGAAILLGLGIAGAVSLGLEVVDTSVKSWRELEQYDIPVICAVPDVLAPEEIRRERLKSVLWGAGLGSSFVSVGLALVYLIQKGYIVL